MNLFNKPAPYLVHPTDEAQPNANLHGDADAEQGDVLDTCKPKGKEIR